MGVHALVEQNSLQHAQTVQLVQHRNPIPALFSGDPKEFLDSGRRVPFRWSRRYHREVRASVWAGRESIEFAEAVEHHGVEIVSPRQTYLILIAGDQRRRGGEMADVSMRS